ncbi:UNVERIFIED_ORG: polyhydroxyalkanoate synthesis regulator phasin [Rhizobium esperanzae]|nr:polyhydroxyalkanoate synthesis regulator phasin [Rhizobium esperanzae]
MTEEYIRKMLGSLEAAIHTQMAIQVHLFGRLVTKGIISRQEGKEVLDDALAELEGLQTKAYPHEHWIYELARGHVEAALPTFGEAKR